MADNDKAYQRIADEYMQAYGAQLRSELDSLEQSAATRITPVLDRRIQREIDAHKRARLTRYTAAIAACLVFAVLAPFLLRTYAGGNSAPSQSASSSADPTTSQSTTSGQGASSSTDVGTQAGTSSTAPPPAYEILALTFDLPPRFTVASLDQDFAKTVYLLSDRLLDDVTLTMERAGDLTQFSDLAPLSIDGHSAYGSSGDGYSLLAFMDEDSDILYVLTCKHDINTLLHLAKSILL